MIQIKRVREVTIKETLTIEVSTDFIQNYLLFSNKVVKLNYLCSYTLLNFILLKMNNYNHIQLDKLFRESYIEWMKGYDKIYTDSMISKSIAEIINAELIIKLSRARYVVNPILFWKNYETKRIDMIRYLISNNYISANPPSSLTEGTC